MTNDRSWTSNAVRLIEADRNRSADTHLLRVDLPATLGVSLYLKDESTHPTGSLKHRLARSLFLHALCNGWIGPDTVVVEASSGSTAVSEAYFARMLGLRFIAVMPGSTSAEKVEQIGFQGGECRFVDKPGEVYAASAALAAELRGHYMDQFTYAERATDWRGNNNIAEAIFSQMAAEDDPVPSWVVVGAGTGGTSATIGRYIRWRRLPTKLCLADPEASVFHRHLRDRSVVSSDSPASAIEGIGRARLEPSFIPALIDRALAVTDQASIGAALALSEHVGRPCGGSTGTNLCAAATLIAEMARAGTRGSVVTLLCDSGDRYQSTLGNAGWRQSRNLEVDAARTAATSFLRDGVWAQG